ncbi:hypothetical protein FIV42_24910 [Persicimonas caeni]|uniref:RCK N-terminal domain-containing protein n=1 Tax=Persicimonas caeni TaxID=2292766 RepID=A0A4Y6Q1I9_PERCE|nr:cation:proton antiporter [Persicimonas caeni]QDG53865.1 hypothetical protein FIV42_24910 [Persicimonas caeni]QED35086.1 hypothetical protein FRD00_24905 [Persicimonas caeni]
MTTIALAIAVAAVAVGLARRTGLPPAVMAILAGVALSAAPVALDGDLVRQGLLLAATFLIFAAGTETERETVIHCRPTAIAITAANLIVTAAIALVLWSVLRLDPLTLTYLVLALASSSTLLAVALFRKSERFFDPVGRIVRATSFTQDAAVIALLTLLFVVLPDDAPTPRSLAVVAALAALTWITKTWVAPRVLLRSKLGEEERLLFVLGLIFSFVGACWWADLPFILGVFLAAFSLSAFPVGGTVRSYVASFSDFFTVLFFVLLGVLVTVPNPTQFVAESILVVGVFLVRPLVLWLILRRRGMTRRSALEMVAALANVGELSLVVVLIGLKMGHVGEALLAVVAALAVVTMAAAPLVTSDKFIRKLLRFFPTPNRPPLSHGLSGHVVLIGCGETGQLVLDELQRRQISVVVIDEDPGVVERLVRQEVPAIRGDGSDPRILQHARAKAARCIISTMSRASDNLQLLSDWDARPVLVRVYSEAAGEAIRRLGGTPIAETRLAEAAFFEWYAQQANPSTETPTATDPGALPAR